MVLFAALAIAVTASTIGLILAFIAMGNDDTDLRSSTAKRHKSALPRWNSFAAEEGIPSGEENFPCLVDDEGRPTKSANKMMQRFASFIDKMSDMTYDVWIVGLNFVQCQLNVQMANHDLSDPKGYIRGLPAVQRLNKKWCKTRNRRTLTRNNEAKHIDMHGKLEKNMSLEQKLKGIEACLNDDPRLKRRPLNSLNLTHSFVSAHAHCSRSESDRLEFLCCNFLKFLPGIGPKGQVASCVFNNGGKSDSSGRLDHNGSVAHLNSMQSMDAIKGMNYFFRYDCIGERFPDFSNPENYHNVPSLRKDADETESINYDLLKDKHKFCAKSLISIVIHVSDFYGVVIYL